MVKAYFFGTPIMYILDLVCKNMLISVVSMDMAPIIGIQWIVSSLK